MNKSFRGADDKTEEIRSDKVRYIIIYSPDSPAGSADFDTSYCYLPPVIGTHSFTMSPFLRECNALSAAGAIHTVSIFYPLTTHYLAEDCNKITV